MRLAGQAAIITGSTKGIGREIAVRFAREGCRVVIHGMDAARAEEARAECGEGAEIFLGDIAREDVAASLTAFAMEKFGRLNILIPDWLTSFSTAPTAPQLSKLI